MRDNITMQEYLTGFQSRENQKLYLCCETPEAQSGEQFTGVFFGDGSDPGDKGVYKAFTGAQKHALMKTFLVATGDDPEREVESIPTLKPLQNEESKHLKELKKRR